MTNAGDMEFDSTDSALECAAAAELLKHLNGDAVGLDRLSNAEEVEILGMKMVYSEESDVHSSSVSARLTGKNASFRREGIKEISYGNWVYTNWIGEWELV